jgi:hypothetical protein
MIQSQVELYRALYTEQPLGEYVKSLSLILFGVAATTIKEIGAGQPSEACFFLSCELLGRSQLL